MSDLNVIDQFLATFTAYIDSGFGLLKGDLAHLTSLLIALDVTIGALFWSLDDENNILGRLVKKVLYIGTFAYILNNFQTLASLVFQSFAQLGLAASGNTLTAGDMLKPGRLAEVGFEAAHPLLTQISDLVGLDTLLPNLLTILILLIAWLLVILAFFILAIQLFITVLEFKLTSLAGFVLVPFAFWNKTTFLAERVLGNVITSGIKVMVLAVIVGIGSSFFDQFITALGGAEPDLAQTLSLVLASLTLLGLGIFGPGIASGLVAGAPQLGAGAAIGTAGAAVASGVLAGGAVAAMTRMVGGGALGTIKTAASLAQGGKGGGASTNPPSSPPPASGGAKSGAEGKTPPAWAAKMQTEQRLRGHLHAAQTAIAAGDQPVASATPDLSQKE
ncbi:P-type conjugative transfer protein TrbL [Asticcacaulis sp.]|uniref:P-type conjugative transfer protein TrbL n=1 Tax=Asticcacaulis sp. TaxID=1872648 RepID=UPI003F7C0C5F